MSRRRPPLYFRLLRVRHLRFGPLTLFLLFEGSIALALLLYLAEIVDEWGLIAIPVVVAIMVKLNDAVAGALIRPLALAQLRTPRPSEQPALGRSPVPRPSYLTRDIDLDDAVPSADARPSPQPEASGVARGIAQVPEENLLGGRRRPAPGIPESDSIREHSGELESIEHAELGSDPTDESGPRPDGADRRSRGNQGRFME